ncbi:hypothetical protein ACJX0J_020156, partial [Zea mays]
GWGRRPRRPRRTPRSSASFSSSRSGSTDGLKFVAIFNYISLLLMCNVFIILILILLNTKGEEGCAPFYSPTTLSLIIDILLERGMTIAFYILYCYDKIVVFIKKFVSVLLPKSTIKFESDLLFLYGWGHDPRHSHPFAAYLLFVGRVKFGARRCAIVPPTTLHSCRAQPL